MRGSDLARSSIIDNLLRGQPDPKDTRVRLRALEPSGDNEHSTGGQLSGLDNDVANGPVPVVEIPIAHASQVLVRRPDNELSQVTEATQHDALSSPVSCMYILRQTRCIISASRHAHDHVSKDGAFRAGSRGGSGSIDEPVSPTGTAGKVLPYRTGPGARRSRSFTRSRLPTDVGAD